jgi:hypothetical protein
VYICIYIYIYIYICVCVCGVQSILVFLGLSADWPRVVTAVAPSPSYTCVDYNSFILLNHLYVDLDLWPKSRSRRKRSLSLPTSTAEYIFLGISNNDVGRDSVVGIGTRYELDGPGIESRRGRVFRTRPDRHCGLPSLLYSGYRVIPGGKAAGAWRWPPTPI